MSTNQYDSWMDKKERYLKENRNKHFKSREEKRVYFENVQEHASTRTRYEFVIQLAIQEYILSTDGVVTALQFDEKQKRFVLW